MDLDALLLAREEDSPSGEDLEYDQDFTEMELAALPGEEKQAGDEFIPAEDPDYKEVTVKALAVMARSHDLRAGVFLANSELRLRGLEGLAEATGYLRGVLEGFWATCHPELDEDDDNDPTMRVNSILALADGESVLRSLKLAPLTNSRTFGRLSMRDIAVASGEITPPAGMDTVPDAQSVAAAFQDTDADLLEGNLISARTIVENVEAINAVFDAETPGAGPDLDPLVRILKQIVSQLGDVVGTGAADDVGEDAQAAGDDAGRAPANSGGGGAVGAINSANDVQNALDRIMAYYQRTEPSSPVPILLARAKRLVGADFLSIVKDMAPHGVENVNLIGGISDEEY